MPRTMSDAGVVMKSRTGSRPLYQSVMCIVRLLQKREQLTVR